MNWTAQSAGSGTIGSDRGADGDLRLMRHRTKWLVRAPTKDEHCPLAGHDLNVHGLGGERVLTIDGVDHAPLAEAAEADTAEVLARHGYDENVGLQDPDKLVPEWGAVTEE